MSDLDSAAAWAASAAIIGITLVPLIGTWVINLRRSGNHRAQVSQLANIFLKSALPVYILAVTLAIVSPAIAAAIYGKRLRSSNTAAKAMVYTSLTASFLVVAASILTTVAVYLTGFCLLYMALMKQKWWKLLRIDCISGAALLFILDIAWWARNLSNLQRGEDEGLTLNWLLVIVDIVLALITAGVVGVVMYSMPKLMTRTDMDIGKMPSLLLTASFLWLIRCTFVLVVDIKTTIPGEWTVDELNHQKIFYPIFDFWIASTVLALVTLVLRRPIWSDPAAIPEELPGQSQQMYAQPPPVYYPAPQHAYQQHPQSHMQPQVYYYPPQQGQAPVPVQQQPPTELTATPVPAARPAGA